MKPHYPARKRVRYADARTLSLVPDEQSKPDRPLPCGLGRGLWINVGIAVVLGVLVVYAIMRHR